MNGTTRYVSLLQLQMVPMTDCGRLALADDPPVSSTVRLSVSQRIEQAGARDAPDPGSQLLLGFKFENT